MTELRSSELKERERCNWAQAAEGWRRRHALLKKGAAPVTQRMLELCGIGSGHRLLDIASGTGEPAISAARIVGDSGRVIGTDLVEEMLAVARENAESEHLANIDFHCCDAEMLELAAGSFDAVTIRWGLMFMPEPEACLVAAHRALKQDGRICVACWGAPERNPFVGLLMQALSHYMEVPAPPPGTPGIFALADPDRLH
ncbi:MAG TPA: methyltransferase domain-containing protein, partial [Gammaproteobacteria bacterium]|nr:methyltransferase domain-containing protein [Gammaproteobacteria bacterium]